MGRGRITRVEQAYRIEMLLRFIFIFRYATREQLFKFGQDRLGLSYQRWLIDYSVKQSFIAAYREPALSLKVYYLTQRGKELISKYEPFSGYYRFGHKNAGLNTLEHQKAVIESYFYLYKQLEIKEWIPEWVIRKDRKAKDKIPDGVMVVSSGIRIALEVETWYKKRSTWEVVVYIPQMYFETKCNEEDIEFEAEVKSVIFSHINDEEKYGKKNLDELLAYRTASIDSQVEILIGDIDIFNGKIIALEKDPRETEHQQAFELHLVDFLKDTEPPYFACIAALLAELRPPLELSESERLKIQVSLETLTRQQQAE